MTIFDQIREDVQKGARGPWTFEIETGDWPDQYLIDGNGDPVLEWDFDLGFCISAPNARRIARVPELERIALAAEELAAAIEDERNMVCQDFGMQLQANNRVDAALAKLREATA